MPRYPNDYVGGPPLDPPPEYDPDDEQWAVCDSCEGEILMAPRPGCATPQVHDFSPVKPKTYVEGEEPEDDIPF